GSSPASWRSARWPMSGRNPMTADATRMGGWGRFPRRLAGWPDSSDASAPGLPVRRPSRSTPRALATLAERSQAELGVLLDMADTLVQSRTTHGRRFRATHSVRARGRRARAADPGGEPRRALHAGRALALHPAHAGAPRPEERPRAGRRGARR